MKTGNLIIIWVLTIGHVLDKGLRYKREEVIYLLKMIVRPRRFSTFCGYEYPVCWSNCDDTD